MRTVMFYIFKQIFKCWLYISTVADHIHIYIIYNKVFQLLVIIRIILYEDVATSGRGMQTVFI